MKNNILKYGLLAIMWLATTLPAFASPGDPDDGDDPLPAPVDNWILVLILIGTALGVYFILKYNKKVISHN